MKDLLARLHTIHGHLRAVERLVTSGRTLEASAQLTAVREALVELGVRVYRGHVERCLRDGASPSQIGELLAQNRIALKMAARAERHCRHHTDASPRRWTVRSADRQDAGRGKMENRLQS